MSDQDPQTPGNSGGYMPPASQEELNRIIEQRLSRERAKFADYDDVRAKAAKLDEIEAASKTELQKLQDAIAERDAQLADLPKQVRQHVVRFASMATHAGFLDPEDALLNLDVDLADVDAVKAALADLAERKPHLVRPQKPSDRLPQRPKAPDGNPAGVLLGDDPKERAAAALRALRS